MELKIISQKENPLLNRLEVEVEITHPKEPTPTRQVVLLEVAKMLNKPVNLGVVKTIRTSFGSNISKARINFYNTEEDLKKTEPEHIIKKSKVEVQESKEEQKEEQKEETESKPETGGVEDGEEKGESKEGEEEKKE